MNRCPVSGKFARPAHTCLTNNVLTHSVSLLSGQVRCYVAIFLGQRRGVVVSIQHVIDTSCPHYWLCVTETILLQIAPHHRDVNLTCSSWVIPAGDLTRSLIPALSYHNNTIVHMTNLCQAQSNNVFLSSLAHLGHCTFRINFAVPFEPDQPTGTYVRPSDNHKKKMPKGPIFILRLIHAHF